VRRPQVATVLEGCPGHFEGCDFQFGAIDWSPTTDSIAATVADPGGWDVWFFRTDGTFIERPWPHDDDEWSAVWSPRATWLAVIRDTLVSSTYTWERTYRLEMVRPDGSARQTVSVVGKVVPETDALPPLTLRATWGPWGRLLAFSTPTGRIYVIRRDGTRKRFLTRGTQPDWKPFPLPIEPPHGPCLPGYPCP
jgi:hypothetical protein